MEIIATSIFLHNAKKIAKRYKSFNDDYHRLLEELEKSPNMGIDLGSGLRKVRLAISSKGKGKSGGCRFITFNAIERNGVLYLLYAYDKSEISAVSIKVMKEYIKLLGI